MNHNTNNTIRAVNKLRYGGRLFESVPGSTPFGAPTKVLPLGSTLRTKDELWELLTRELARVRPALQGFMIPICLGLLCSFQLKLYLELLLVK